MTTRLAIQASAPKPGKSPAASGGPARGAPATSERGPNSVTRWLDTVGTVIVMVSFLAALALIAGEWFGPLPGAISETSQVAMPHVADGRVPPTGA